MRRMPGVRSSLTYRRPATFADSGGGSGLLMRASARMRRVCRVDRCSAARSWCHAFGNARFIPPVLQQKRCRDITHVTTRLFTVRVFSTALLATVPAQTPGAVRRADPQRPRARQERQSRYPYLDVLSLLRSRRRPGLVAGDEPDTPLK